MAQFRKIWLVAKHAFSYESKNCIEIKIVGKNNNILHVITKKNLTRSLTEITIEKKVTKNNSETTIQRLEPIAAPDVTLIFVLPWNHFGINDRLQLEAFAVRTRWLLLNKFVFLSHD